MKTHAASQQSTAQYEYQIQTLQTQNIQLQSRCDEYATAYDALQHQLKELIRYRFGQRSERYLDPENPQALSVRMR